MQPAIHARQSFRKIALGMAKRNLIEPARNGHIAAERIPHQLLVETLDGRQDCQFKLKILGQENAPASEILPVG